MIGKKVAHYEVIGKIGAGGMGEVYRARDLKLQREVAIKFLPSALPSGSEERERLKREARTLAALNHPNIVTVYSVEEEGGIDFVTMELLEGESLDKVVSRGVTLDQFVELVTQLLDAMGAAHQRGIVHRDLKPANIMIAGNGRLKVVDFGIAKVFLGGPASGAVSDQQDLPTQLLTQPGLVRGTISYFSPEQAQGQRVDQRSDIFSLGIIFYEMCTGRHPFPGKNAATIITSILRDAPAPFADCEPWGMRICPVIERCLEKDPQQRYQQVSDIVGDLKASLQQPLASASKEVTGDLIQAGRAAIAQHAWAEALQYLQEADAVSELSPDDLDQLAEAAFWSGKLDDYCDLLRRAYAGYLRHKQPRRAAMMALKLADVLYHKTRQLVSTGWLKRAEKLLEKEENSVEYGYLLRFKSVVALEIEGDTESALRFAKQTLEVGNRTDDKDLLAFGIQDQGRVLVDQGQLADGMALLDEAMASVLSGELNPLTVAKTYCNMISACERTADYRRASEWTEEARHWGEPHASSPFPGICSVHRAEIMRLKGSLQEAEREAQRVCADAGGFDDVAAAAFYEVGEIRLRKGDFTGADEAFREAHQRGHNPVPGLPLLLLEKGEIDAGRSLLTRALAGVKLPLGRARLLPAHIRIILAAGDVEGASIFVEEFEAIASQFGSAALKAAAAHALGSLNLVNRDFENASINLRRALDFWLDAELPYEAADTRMLLAQAYRSVGDAASASLELSAARSTFERLGAQSALHKSETQISLGDRIGFTP